MPGPPCRVWETRPRITQTQSPFSRDDRQRKRYASSPYSDEIVVQVTPAQQQEEPEMLWVTGPVLAVILIILIVIAILLFKR
ncbi:hypothetical protein P7K49_016111 [Saguinus oedipus]|uniref:Uncharacterized protein n=1 Tax=Saguinus oedipus TaxID=9490 RepID=A0ABQ9VDZ1_SAGOE|nr:hypothetical protein P7K49_016111 [Saguinus oedipus]